MNKLVLVGIAFLGCALGPEAVSAQCIRCEAKGPLQNLTFDVGKTETQRPPAARLIAPALQPEPVLRTEPIDCAMVKKVDPKFHAATPIIKPDSKTKFSLRVVVAPPCK
jgi:hypothetical protein